MTQEIEILQYLHYNPLSSREEISAGVSFNVSAATIKRMISESIEKKYIEVVGLGRSTR